jgi:anti-sigma B factor antagonist
MRTLAASMHACREADILLCTIPFERAAVRLAGDLDVFALPSMERSFAQVDADIVVVDLTEVTFIGAAALGCLAGLKKRLRSNGRLGIVRIVGATPRVQQLFSITGLDKVFDISDSIAQGQ